MLIAATNAENNELNNVKNQITKKYGTVPEVAREYKSDGKKWVVIGEENYGEGSSREHAALEPRNLGGVAIIVKSFARIHETNLKKQGILPLTFVNANDYDLISPENFVNLIELDKLAPNRHVTCQILDKMEGKVLHEIKLQHSLSDEQIEWFKAGSALNYMGNILKK